MPPTMYFSNDSHSWVGEMMFEAAMQRLRLLRKNLEPFNQPSANHLELLIKQIDDLLHVQHDVLVHVAARLADALDAGVTDERVRDALAAFDRLGLDFTSTAVNLTTELGGNAAS